jgi:hypothetical protein
MPPMQPPRALPTPGEPRGDAAYLTAGERAVGDERAVFDALRSASFGGADPMRTSEAPAPAQARRLLDESRLALRARRHAPEALDLAVKAFGADPRDPDVASHLASLELRVLPPQPERARQLALHAIAMRGSEAARADDWIMLGIASALVGRLADARNAFYASLALSRNADRTCRAVLAALAMHGERLRDPVDALVVRLHVQGRADDAPACGSPQGRTATRFF